MKDGNHRLVERIFGDAQFIRSLGIELISCGQGWCETRMAVATVHRQQHGLVHGGVIMTLADHTCGGAAASTVAEDRDVITVENKVTFLRPSSSSELFCRGNVLRAGRTLIFVEAEVMADNAEGRRVMIAKASSTLAVIPLAARSAEKPLA